MICIKRPTIGNKYMEFIGEKLALYIYILYPAIKYIILYIYEYLNIHNPIYMWIYPIVCLIMVILISYLICIGNKRIKNIWNNKIYGAVNNFR